ncbi:spore-associated protein A [Streptomyces odonnellii]|uniref:spore-associated protein A n=1 Tax=Streptomyces odonnellii TaxID=1417980 RepID=UPI0012FEE088|nr:spore-associated protein A [Streptomyces odonnellii]
MKEEIMNSTKKRVIATIAAAVSIGGFTVAVAPGASAAPAGAYGCAGSEIDTYAVKTSGGATWGTIHLYYDSSTGLNCAVNVKTSAGYAGTPSITWVALARSSDGKSDLDSGNFSSYAGPVTISAPGQCITVSGVVRNPADTVEASVVAKNVHCG